MNRAELKEGLRALPVPDACYFLDGVDDPGRAEPRDIGETVLTPTEDGAAWYTFIAERGKRHNVRLHTTESEACEAVWAYLSALARRRVVTIPADMWEHADVLGREQVAAYERWVEAERSAQGS